jgi:hypothetical protein
MEVTTPLKSLHQIHEHSNEYCMINDHPVIYVSVGILLTCGRYLHDRFTSLTEEAWVPKTNLAQLSKKN